MAEGVLLRCKLLVSVKFLETIILKSTIFGRLIISICYETADYQLVYANHEENAAASQAVPKKTYIIHPALVCNTRANLLVYTGKGDVGA